ncbi:hypothetical protein ACFSKW_12105 [Nonomuraea mangrovi]|uniref:Uncharacterized protein n=1 Tax=Nonomuraea mangrovi TaxID=2316207 RepID=A0ABW4SUE4_9ACTN
MSGREVVFAFVAGLIVNEMCDVSPWLAKKLVRRSAYLRYRDPIRAEVRTEELIALIDSRPGKLLKLFTAIGFLGAGTGVRVREYLRNLREGARFLSSNPRLVGLTLRVAMNLTTGRRRKSPSATEESLRRALKEVEKARSKERGEQRSSGEWDN